MSIENIVKKKGLLLGCGHDHRRKLYTDDGSEVELVTLDMSSEVGADVVWDLENRPLPFADEEFDELHAYDVLEHVGRQGDWRGYFEEFGEYWRILKPGGTFSIIVPVGNDHFADPGHTRFFSHLWFAFLSQKNYEQIAKEGTQMTDYRFVWKKDFDVIVQEPVADHHLCIMLKKVV